MKRLPESTWQQIRVAFAGGTPLREIARNLGIPEGTVLARSKREAWGRKNREAAALVPVKPVNASPAVADTVALSMRQRGERHVGRVAGFTERLLASLEGMDPDKLLQFVDELEKTDKVARRTYGLDGAEGSTVLQVGIMLGALADLTD